MWSCISSTLTVLVWNVLSSASRGYYCYTIELEKQHRFPCIEKNDKKKACECLRKDQSVMHAEIIKIRLHLVYMIRGNSVQLLWNLFASSSDPLIQVWFGLSSWLNQSQCVSKWGIIITGRKSVWARGRATTQDAHSSSPPWETLDTCSSSFMFTFKLDNIWFITIEVESKRVALPFKIFFSCSTGPSFASFYPEVSCDKSIFKNLEKREKSEVKSGVVECKKDSEEEGRDSSVNHLWRAPFVAALML